MGGEKGESARSAALAFVSHDIFLFYSENLVFFQVLAILFDNKIILKQYFPAAKTPPDTASKRQPAAFGREAKENISWKTPVLSRRSAFSTFYLKYRTRAKSFTAHCSFFLYSRRATAGEEVSVGHL
jgi:hypothetical protein